MHFIPTEGFPSHAWVSFGAPFRPRCRGNEFMLIHLWAEASCQSGFHWKYVLRSTCSQKWSAHSNAGWVRDYTAITCDWPINTLSSIKVINKLRGMELQMAAQFGRALVLGFHSCRHGVELAEPSTAISNKHLGKLIHIALIYSSCNRCDSWFKYLISSSHIVSRQLDVRGRGDGETILPSRPSGWEMSIGRSSLGIKVCSYITHLCRMLVFYTHFYCLCSKTHTDTACVLKIFYL